MDHPSPASSPPADFRPAVVIPTYNNAGTLPGVLHRAEALGLAIFAVDDGSTDHTGPILKAWLAPPHRNVRTVLSHPRNLGKADALRTGFAATAHAGFTHAVTIDSDGQHDPAHVPPLLDAAGQSPTALVLGVRREDIEHCPPRSLMARRVANSLTALECGQRLTDTQCGLRVYPLGLIAAVPCRARRYGYEAEIITRAAWAGCPIREVPIGCVYFPADRRVSHFQPYRDSARQLRMHAGLIARALFPWPPQARWPGESHGGLPPPAKVIRATGQWFNPVRAWREIRDDPNARPQVALGLALGVLLGNFPPGLHTVAALYVARQLHLHPIPVLLGTQIAIPPLGFALIGVQYYVGHFLLGGLISVGHRSRAQMVGAWTIEYFVGWPIVGVALAIITYFVARAILRLLPVRRPPA